MRRTTTILAVVVATTLAISGSALADSLQADADGDALAAPRFDVLSATQAAGTTVSYDVSALVHPGGTTSDDVFPGVVAVSITRSGDWLAVDASGTGAPDSFSFSEYNTSQAGAIRVTVPPCTPSGVVKTMTARLTAGPSSGNPATAGRTLPTPTVVLTYHITATDGTCAPNSAPVVDSAAVDAFGTEGDVLQASGSFTDADPGDALALSVPAGTPGTFTDLGGGAWSWSRTTNDDVPTGTIVVTATDPDGATAADTFDFGADNADPVVGSVSVTPTGACSVNVSTTFTDPGTADTHTGTINWGDGSGTTAAAIAQGAGSGTASGSHAYTTSGVKTMTVSVTDDDGGAGASAGTFTTKNDAGTFLAPINTGAGPRSVFKLGSTIPVKIIVTDCAGSTVTTLTPVVQLQMVDSVPDGAVNEAQISEVPTNGRAMTWVGNHYQFVLSTKRSQFTGGALTPGSYRLWVTDPSFATSPTAYFDLR